MNQHWCKILIDLVCCYSWPINSENSLVGGLHAMEILGDKEEKVAVSCALVKTGKCKLLSLKPVKPQQFFSRTLPSPFILYFKKQSNKGICASFILKRDARYRWLSPLPYNCNMLDWFTWSIIYQFLWDCSQNKILFSVMMAESIPDGKQLHMCSRDTRIQGK